LPPLGLANFKKQRIPVLAKSISVDEDIENTRALSPCFPRPKQLKPCLPTNAVAIQRSIDFQESIEASKFFSSLVDPMPRTGSGGVYLASLRGGATAQPITKPFGTGHRADECCLPKNAIPTHPAAKESPFYEPLYRRDGTRTETILFATAGPIRSLETRRGEQGHR
jgi:hypothetical protein